MKNSIKIGVVGFSRNQFDKESAIKILNSEFIKLYEKYANSRRVEIVSGYTKMGVPEIAYNLADKYGFQKTGFSARQALKVKSGLYKVDKEIIVGEKFGDESIEFIKYIDALIRIGGGKQSREEVTLFKEMYKHLPLNRLLKEYEVDWYGHSKSNNRSKLESTLFGNYNHNLQSKQTIVLDENNHVFLFRAVEGFALSESNFEKLWNTHPNEFHQVMMHGKLVDTPRWQQSYGKNYEYTGSKNNALPLLEIHQKYLNWSQSRVDSRINGLLVNWYSGELKHYIGKHRDSVKGLLDKSPIITVSHGGERIFRFRPYGDKGYKDVLVKNGDVIVIPWKTNQVYTHEVPYHKKYDNDRISVTLRAYQ